MVLSQIQELASGFEGCEKKVEIDFFVPAGGPDLRAIPRDAIDAFLSLAKCTVISTKHNEHFNSYLLSESSLFIFPSKIILKTCGTTLLLKSVGAILAAAKAIGATPDFLQFSRSNFIFPSKQHFPHRAFSEETDYLNKLLGMEGDAFILGPLQGPRWHLYIVDFNRVDAAQYKQQTCELIMFNLDREVMKQFYQLQTEGAEGAAAASAAAAGSAPMDESKEDKILCNSAGQGFANIDGEGTRTGAEATKRSGIDLLLPGSDIDGFLFSPCGYSCNGLLKDTYFTIHITPEPECSFVSFETNYNTPSFTALVNLVTKTFKPGSFCMSLFVDEESLIADSRKGIDWNNIAGYTAKATTHHVFQAGYNATCAHYELAQPASVEKGSAAFGVAASSAASALKPMQHPLDGLVGPASYETIASLPAQQIGTLAKDAARTYVEFETPLDEKEMEAEEIAAASETPRGEGEVVSTSSSAWLNACAQGVVARHQPEQSFVLVNLGQLTSRFHTWATRFPRVQPFLSVGDWGLDAGMLCVLSALGCGFAFNSGAGLSHVIAAGVPASRLMFEREFLASAQLRAARDQHVEFFTVHSKSELNQVLINHPKAKLLLRVHVKDSATHSALAAEVEEITKLAAEATALGLTVAGVRLQTVSSVSLASLKATILALQAPFKASLSTSYSFDVLDLGSALNELSEAECAQIVALLDQTFTDGSVRYHANATTFLEQRTHTLYLNVLAKEAAAAGTANGDAAAAAAAGAKRKAGELSVNTASTDFVYHVSTALAPPSNGAQAKVSAIKPRAGAALHSSSLAALPSAPGAPSPPVGCLVAELSVGDWLAVQESAAWCPSSFLAPHSNVKGQYPEPLTYYVFGQQ